MKNAKSTPAESIRTLNLLKYPPPKAPAWTLGAVVFLYIGMVGMDKSNKKKFYNIYGKMVGIKFSYEIDAENIIITDEENDSDTFSWNDIVKWNQDPDNIYLFVGDDNCLVVSKKGFTQGSADDLRQLADAVIGMRNVTGNSQQ